MLSTRLRTASLVWLGVTIGIQPCAAQLLDDAPTICEFQPVTALADIDKPVVDADHFSAIDEHTVALSGNIVVRQHQQKLITNKAVLNKENGEVHIPGELDFMDKDMQIHAQSGELKGELVQMEQLEFSLNQSLGHGSADKLERNADSINMQQFSFTSCPGPDPLWHINSKTVEIDFDEGLAKTKHTTFRVGNVPVLYVPWFDVPLDDRRRSGVLAPAMRSDSEGGVDFALPYYFNLAENYDATVVGRVIQNRGIMAGGEFRYLTSRHKGELFAEYLPNDDLVSESRYQINFKNTTRIIPGWNWSTYIKESSDPRYFRDFGDSLQRVSARYSRSSSTLRGSGKDWWFSLEADHYNLLDENLGQSSLPYQRLPRVHFVYSPWMKQSWVQPDLQVDTVHFRRVGYDSATRTEIYPSLALYWQKPWAYAKLKAGQRYTQYQLQGSSPERSIPIVSIDGGGYFDRDFKWGNKLWQQTLEPRLFYLNIPYRDQQGIPRFDTSEMDFSFSQLFSENRFSGGDRQMDANQLTTAITSRVLSASGEEKLSLKAGQIFYFDSPRVGLNDDLNIEQSKSASVLEAAYKFSNQWTVSATNQWDQLENTSDKTTFRVRGPFVGKGFASLSYRYRRGQLEQVDTSVFWPINQRWHALARWNYSLKDKQNLETVAGVAYQSCCWSVRLVGRRYALDDRDAQLVQKTSFYLELNLTGLGSFGSGGQNIVERAIYGYTEFD